MWDSAGQLFFCVVIELVYKIISTSDPSTCHNFKKINLTTSGSKRKKSTAGVATEDDLPDHLHYHGSAPKQYKECPGIFSTPVIPFFIALHQL